MVDLLLDLHVDRARRVVEHEDRRVDEQRAGDRHALALAAGKRVAPLPDDRVVAIGHADDELVGVGRLGCGDDLFDRGVGFAVGDVVPDRDREQERLVEDEADVCPQALERVLTHVLAVDVERALGHVVGAVQQSADGRLPRSGPPDERDGLPGLDVEVEVPEHPRAVGVVEADVVVLDLAAALDHVDGARDGSRPLVADPGSRRSASPTPRPAARS